MNLWGNKIKWKRNYSYDFSFVEFKYRICVGYAFKRLISKIVQLLNKKYSVFYLYFNPLYYVLVFAFSATENEREREKAYILQVITVSRFNLYILYALLYSV